MHQPVLNYHAIGEPSSAEFAEWAIDPADFASQLDLLSSRGLTGVTMARALKAPSDDEIALTFDDGYEDFVTLAVPELAARGFGATLFVATSHVGKTARWLDGEGAGARPMATWEQLREIESRGFEIGSHSHTHPQLDLLSPAALAAEIDDGTQALAEGLGHAIEGFCYPHGFHGSRVRQAVIDAGYSYACGVKHKMGSVGQDRFSIARIVVRRDDPLDQIDRWIDGHDLRPGGPLVERTLATGFRAYRRLRRGR